MDTDITLTAPLSPDALIAPAVGSSTGSSWPALAPSHAELLASSDYVDGRTSWSPVQDDDVLTEPCLALTAEISIFESPQPIGEPLSGEPAYLVEARPVLGRPILVAIRGTLREAVVAAGTIHPSVADVLIREMPLPCDADSLVRVMGAVRTWTREPDGAWWPPLPAHA